jgi:ArsR family transcriptional regulator, arsenate/arsenite/antimonite-responsive transcriptional repressor
MTSCVAQAATRYDVKDMHAAKLEVRPVSRLFKALGDDTRLRIVALLCHGELCVCHLQAALDLTQSNASRHLSVLRGAGIVEDRRDGTWVYYRLVPPGDPDCARYLRGVMQTYAKQHVLRKDVEQLLKTRGPGACK